MPDLAAELPSALRANARWERLSEHNVPALLVHPDWNAATPAPVVLWMHGRSVRKELDPGRYLRWMRAGIATCAVDLPGHGERHDESLQQREHAFDVITQMIEEIDAIVDVLRTYDGFDTSRIAIGGMSGGGMAAIARLCSSHLFTCATVEATSGSWEHQKIGKYWREANSETFHAFNPIENLDRWREIPFQAIHARGDEWMPYEGQLAFTEELRRRYDNPDLVELVTFDETGAPHEHIGFGRRTIEAKNSQLAFLMRWLMDDAGDS